MHFVPKFNKLVRVNFNLLQCLYVASTGIPTMFIALGDRDFLFSFEVIGYFNGYFMNDTESDNIVHFLNKLLQEPL